MNITNSTTEQWFYFLREIQVSTLLMRCLVRSVNLGTPVQKFIKEFHIKDEVCCVANAWKPVKASTWQIDVVNG